MMLCEGSAAEEGQHPRGGGPQQADPGEQGRAQEVHATGETFSKQVASS